MKIFKIVFILIVVLQSALAFSMGEGPGGSSVMSIGSAAADFTLKDLEGNNVSLFKQKGKVVFLNFFATWCPPCKDEMPSMQALHEELKNEDFIILAVSVDGTGADSVRSFMAENGYTFKVLYDETGLAANKYGANRIPKSFIINKKGIIVSSVLGSKNWSDKFMVAEFRKLIKE